MNTIRWTAMQNLLTQVATIDGTGSYTIDLSNSVLSGFASREERMERRESASVQLVELNEGIEVPQVSPDTLRLATFAVGLDLMVRGSAGGNLRQTLNEGLGDLDWCVHQNPTLGATVNRIYRAATDEPSYLHDQLVAFVLVQFVIEWHYTAGVNI